MTYLIIFDQRGEGCDYTIGCGITYQYLTASDMADAEKKTREILEEEVERKLLAELKEKYG
jgi:hypothetical protein